MKKITDLKSGKLYQISWKQFRNIERRMSPEEFYFFIGKTNDLFEFYSVIAGIKWKYPEYVFADYEFRFEEIE